MLGENKKLYGLQGTRTHPPAAVQDAPQTAVWLSAPLGCSMGCRGQPASPWSTSPAAGESVLRRLEHPLPLLLHWLWCLQSCFSPIVSLLSPATIAVRQGFFALLKYIIPEELPLSLMGLALASGGSVLEPVGVGSIGHRGNLRQLLTEATPVAHPTTKTLPCKLNTVSRSFSQKIAWWILIIQSNV